MYKDSICSTDIWVHPKETDGHFSYLFMQANYQLAEGFSTTPTFTRTASSSNSPTDQHCTASQRNTHQNVSEQRN